MKSQPKILIFDVPDRRSVPIVGSLGKKYSFHYLVPIHKGFAIQPLVEVGLFLFKPRHTRSMHFVSFNNEDDLYAGLLAFVKKKKFDLVMAFSERSTAILCQHADELKQFTQIAHGSFEDFNTLNDKFSILEVCRRVNVPTPRFVSLEKEADIEKTTQLDFPLVVKCRLASGVKEALRICNNIEDVQRAFRELTNSHTKYSFFPADKLVAEEFIKGNIFDCGLAVDHGRIVAAIPQERTQTIPPEGGFAAAIASRDLPELVEYGKRIFNEVKWIGPAQLEFIYDSKDQTYKLIEINPRFWGSVGLSIKAGVNMGDYTIRIGLGDMEKQETVVAPGGISLEWLLQETLTAEKMRGEQGNLILKHIRKIFSSEVSNFSYSIGTNFLLALPHILSNPKADAKKKNQSASLAKRIFE